MLVGTIHNTYGLLFITGILCAILYGAACLQGWFYIRKYWRKDPWFISGLVGLVLALDTVQLGLYYEAIYTYLVTNQGNAAIQGVVVPSLIIELFFSATIALLVQLFYCYRIWKLSQGSYLVTVPVIMLSLAAFISLVIYSQKATKTKTMLELITLANLSTTSQALGAATDVVISLIMMMILQKSKTGFKRSTDVMNRLIIFTFTTGIPTSLCAIMVVAFVNGEPQTFLYIFFYLLVGRFYTNSLLVVLNSREYIRGETSTTSSTGQSYPMNSASRNPHNTNHDTTSVAIRIDTTMHRDEEFSKHDDSYELDARKISQAV